MKQSTAIATAVAVVVVAFFFGGLIYKSQNPVSDLTQGAQQMGGQAGDQSASSTDNTMNTQSDQLQIKDISVGTGAAAKAGDHVYVNYIGTLADGTKFDSSYDRGQPIDFILGAGSVIQGWDQGLIGMKVGGKRELTIPPNLGYGSQAYGPIPANSTLIFQVELVKIGQ